jgi:hypothetical protein
MLEKVSKYCQTMLNRIMANPDNPDHLAQLYRLPPPRHNKFTVTSPATVVYNVERRGFFGIILDNGTKYYPTNAIEFPKILRDRKRVLVTLQYFPGVASFYQWGTTAWVVDVEQLPAK